VAAVEDALLEEEFGAGIEPGKAIGVATGEVICLGHIGTDEHSDLG
jgi:hypothetical protein